MFQIGKKLAVLNGIFSFFIRIAIMGCMASVFYNGTILVFKGEMTIGYCASFLMYMIYLTSNVVTLASVVGNVAKVSGASSRIIIMMQKIPGVNTRGGEIIS